jgi:hypothetical protein
MRLDWGWVSSFGPAFQGRVARFITKIGASDQCGCRRWLGDFTVKGYGKIYFTTPFGVIYGAHRVALFLYTRHYPYKDCACHKCDNPWCVAVGHLWWGSRAENVLDMYAKGRAVNVRGEQCGSSVLTRIDVKIIRKEFAGGLYTMTALARRFHVSVEAISDVVHLETWRDI